MSVSLPAPALHKLEQTLAQWHQWRDAGELPGAPHVVAPLEGISNYTVLAEAAGQQFCVRLDRVNPAANGLNRQVEWRALQGAYEAGIAPRPRYFNPELGALVCDYLPPDEDQATDSEAIAVLLRKIHQLPALHYRLDIAERIRRYRHQLTVAGSPALAAIEQLGQSIAELLRQITPDHREWQLCHNDLNPGNLLYSGGKLYALDWEYSAMGNRWFDLAVACNTQGYELPQQEQLLEQYLERPVAEYDRRLLLQWSCIAHFLELLWYLSQRPDYHDAEVIDSRIIALNALLDSLNPGNY